MAIDDVFAAHGGLATTRQLLEVVSRKTLECHVRAGRVARVRRGVYAATQPDAFGQLAALDLATGTRIVACLGTAAALYGFDTEADPRLHVLDPGIRLRPTADIMVHQRLGAPLRRIGGRLATAPAWTAIEVARTLRRPRALATLDTAVRIGACTPSELMYALAEQKGRRGIVKVRELSAYIDGRSESAMESEARLVFIDGGLPKAELQYEIADRCGDVWRIDFAWPEARLAAEYDSIDWHMGPKALLHDRLKIARLQDCGWLSVPMTVGDVRGDPLGLVARINMHLDQRLAG
ncbi:type IV toxin-antitoxin system AbiEi family antitoxin domain-containing protein [Mycolicibacter minnesotensis]